MLPNRLTKTSMLKTRLRDGLKKEAIAGEIDKRIARSRCCSKFAVLERTRDGSLLESALSTDSADVWAGGERTASLSPTPPLPLLPPAPNAFSVKNKDAVALKTVPGTKESVLETG